MLRLDLHFIYPVHLNPTVQAVANNVLLDVDKVHLLPPVTYSSFVALMKSCYMVITDSGGIQEEAPALDKPVVVTRNTTERMEGVDAGCLVLAGSSENSVVAKCSEILKSTSVYTQIARSTNPFGDGSSARIITDHICARLKDIN